MSTSQVTPTPPRPDFGRLYGITHDPVSRTALLRVPRTLKIGIGIPQGRAIQVFKYGGQWHIRHGVWEEKPGGGKKLVMKTMFRGADKAEAEAWHHKNKDKAAISNRPQKQPWFGFNRQAVIEDAGGRPVAVFEPDFDAIEANGDCPTRLDVILTSENPLRQEDQNWSASELRCHGDGHLAERVLSMGSEKDEWWKYAKTAGLKMFPYSPCRLGGCPFAGKECKQHSTIEIQLRRGPAAYFTSTGQVTASKLFSSLESYRIPLERRGYSIVGVPMQLVLGSFRANHDGKPSKQPYVYLEMTPESIAMLNDLIAASSFKPALIGEAPKQITEAEEYEPPTAADAAIINAEFSDAEFEDDAPEEEPVTAKVQPVAATATAEKQATAGSRLAARHTAPPKTTTAPVVAEPAASAPAAAASFQEGDPF